MPSAAGSGRTGTPMTRVLVVEDDPQVLGVSRRKGWQYVFGPGVGATVSRDSGPDLDVHLITHSEAGKGRGLPVSRGARLGRSRIIWGWLTGIGGPALLTPLLTHSDADLGLTNTMLLFLTLTVGAALLGGLCRHWPRQPSAPCS